MQFAEDRGRPIYKVVKEPDMTMLNPPSNKFHLQILCKMSQALQVDPAVIVPDNAVSTTQFDWTKVILNIGYN